MDLTTAPWWGVPVIAGGFLILGAVLGFFFNSIQDKRRAKRELQHRFYDKVLDYSSQLVRAADDLNLHATSFEAILASSAEHLPQESTNEALETVQIKMSESLVEFYNAHSMLKLVAPKRVRQAAQTLSDRMMAIFLADSTPISVSAANAALDDANDSFQEAVRKQFHLND